jgi:hypothetical protein
MFILTNRYRLTQEGVGIMLDRDHATVGHADRTVRAQLQLKNGDFIDEITKWAEAFSDVLGDDKDSVAVVEERINLTVKRLTNDSEIIVSALKNLLQKYQSGKTTLELVV